MGAVACRLQVPWLGEAVPQPLAPFLDVEAVTRQAAGHLWAALSPVVALRWVAHLLAVAGRQSEPVAAGRQDEESWPMAARHRAAERYPVVADALARCHEAAHPSAWAERFREAVRHLEVARFEASAAVLTAARKAPCLAVSLAESVARHEAASGEHHVLTLSV